MNVLKNYFSFLLFIITNSFFSQNYISVNDIKYPSSSYSIEELIKKVLISGENSDCLVIENVVFSPSLSNRNYGYFNKEKSTFPFKEGLFFSTGYANDITIPNIDFYASGTLYSGSDTDLAQALDVPESYLHDATYIEFDFIPLKDEITFNYLLASSEYSSFYPCEYTDGFALLLKGEGDSNYINLAKLPNGDPISVTNIRPDVDYTNSVTNQHVKCGAKNSTFYAGGYPPSGVGNQISRDANFAGRTIPLKASAKVIPCKRYHFKFVIADYRDRILDTAIFFEAGSLDLGTLSITNSQGASLDTNITKCENESITLTASLSSTIKCFNNVYKWYHNGVLLSSSTKSITITEPGIYTVILDTNTSTGSCSLSTSVEVKSMENPKILGSLNLCSGGSTILTASDVYDSYSWSKDEIKLSTDNSYTVTTPGTYTLTVTKGICTKNISVTVTETKLSPKINNTSLYFGGKTELSCEAIYDSYIWSKDGTQLSTQNKYTATTPGTYTLTITKNGCSASTSITIIGFINIITPNNDGINDSWVLKDLTDGTKVQIYDRYGKLIFEKTAEISKTIEWNGKHLGKVVPTDSYWYVVSIPNEKELSGWIMVRNYNENSK